MPFSVARRPQRPSRPSKVRREPGPGGRRSPEKAVTYPGPRFSPEVKELPAQRLVPLLPAPAPLVKLLLRQRVGGEPLVFDVVGPDLHVCVAHQPAAVAGHGLGDQKVAVRQPYYIHRRPP